MRAGGAKAALLNSRQMARVKNGCDEQKRHSKEKSDGFPPKSGGTVPVCTDQTACPVPADVHGHQCGDKSYHTAKVTLADCLNPKENDQQILLPPQVCPVQDGLGLLVSRKLTGR